MSGTGSRAGIAADDAVVDLLGDIFHGGEAGSRGELMREVPPESWAATTALVDIVR